MNDYNNRCCMSMTKNFDIDCVIEFEVGFSIVEY